MSLQNSVAQYTIQITRDGNGALEATQQLTQLNTTFERTAASSARATEGFHQLHTASTAARASLHELHSVGLAIGAEMAPQATSGLMAIQGGMHAVSAVSKATGASIGGVAAVLAAFVATIYTAVSAHKQLEDVMKINTNGPSTGSVKGAIDEQIKALVEEGKLMKENAESLRGLLFADQDNPEKSKANNFWVMNALRAIQGTQQEEEAAKKLAEIHKQMLEDGLDTISKERFAATSAYEQRIKEIDQLRAKAGTRYNEERADIDKQLAKEALDYQLMAIAQKQEEEQKRKEAEVTTQEIAGFERGLTLQALQSTADKVTIAKREFDQRIEYYQLLYDYGQITEQKLTELMQEASIKRDAILKKDQDKFQIHVKSIKEMEVEAAQSFASSFTQAFDDFVSGSKSAGQAFKEFALSFLKAVSDMILETEILAIIKAIAGIASSSSSSSLPAAGTGGNLSEYSGGFTTGSLAAGGIVFSKMVAAPILAASGLAGVASVSRPTYFPSFNVVAGEAGREMLTVLARPRMMELGGIQSVVGQAGNHTLAISKAGDLAKGTGGRVVIELIHSEEQEARIVSNSIQGAELRITKRMNQSGPLRNAVKKVTK